MAQQSSFGQFMKEATTPRSQRYAISAEDAERIRNAPLASAAPSSVPADSPVIDHAKRILTAASSMNDDQRADSWDHYHSAQDSKDLTTRLNTVNAPDDVKASLVSAKKLSDPKLTAVDKVVDAIHRLAAMDPRTREIAESHPAVLKALLSGSEN
jgi:hypothetical protein